MYCQKTQIQRRSGWIQPCLGDDKRQQSELVEVKANGALITFANHSMIKTYPTSTSKNKINRKEAKSGEWLGNGSGIILTTNGYIATNNHVIEDAENIEVEFLYKDEIRSFNAKVIQTDPTNDLAILKIDDSRFSNLSYIPYNFKSRSADVGEEVFALGYPMALSIMGKEIKFTDGISAKSGYNSISINTPTRWKFGVLYVQGQFIAINSAKLKSDVADNAYSIHILLSLIDAATINQIAKFHLIISYSKIKIYKM